MLNLKTHLAAVIAMVSALAVLPYHADSGTVLPNGWRLTPAGALIPLPGDMPLRILPAQHGQSMLIVTGGYHDHGISVVDPINTSLRQGILLGKAWAGLAVDRRTGKVFVSGGGPAFEGLQSLPEIAGLSPEIRATLSEPILQLHWENKQLVFSGGISVDGLTEKNRFIAGLATDAQGNLFAINIATDTLLKLELPSGRILASARTGYRPFQLAISPDGASVAVANWGDNSVSILDASTLSEKARVQTGAHPTDLAFSGDGRLFVANAGANSVSAITGLRVGETILTSLSPNDPVGSTPNALAVDSIGHRLYVANADNNNVAVVDISTPGHASVLGFIPTGWYPSAIALTPDGKRMVVGIAKGIRSRANWPPQLNHKKQDEYDQSAQPFDYIGKALAGYAEVVPVPDQAELDQYSRQARANVPNGEQQIDVSSVREAQQAFQQIKHVVYIIRENRTYDQVLGDDPRGDGEKELALFGERVTPNAHALASLTPLLDRFFLNGEVSHDGHYFANGAYSTAFNERQTATWYGSRGYPDADERLDLAPSGFLWDSARRAGLSSYNYGEFFDSKVGRDHNSQINFVRDHGLLGHTAADWPNWPEVSDLERAKIVIRDLKAAERTGHWPNYIVINLLDDHTAGLTPGRRTPQGMVAANDLALGMVVEAISHSPFWASTAIFVTEDDAQSGPDHVDDHRSIGLVISPYTRKGLVDHTPYTMTSMLRTMELLLHLPPMTQYDRDSTPMYRLFSARPSLWTYTARPENVDLAALNPNTGPLAAASSQLDFSGVDRADPDKLNAILWAAMRPGMPMPAIVHSAWSAPHH